MPTAQARAQRQSESARPKSRPEAHGNFDINAARTTLLETLAESIDSGEYDAALETTKTWQLDELAKRMLSALPTRHPLDSQVGPFYDTAGITQWLGVTRQAIHKQIKSRRILGLKTTDDVILYPTFQFDNIGNALPGLREVLDLIDPHDTDEWSSALWLNTTARALGGDSPATRMQTGDLGSVLAIAQRIFDSEHRNDTAQTQYKDHAQHQRAKHHER